LDAVDRSALHRRWLEQLRSRRFGASLPTKTLIGFIAAIVAVVTIAVLSFTPRAIAPRAHSV
jgi:hypothetical protein